MSNNIMQYVVNKQSGYHGGAPEDEVVSNKLNIPNDYETVHTITREISTEKHSNVTTYLVIAILGVLVIMVIAWFFFSSSTSSFESLVSNNDPLGKCNWVVYTMEGCPWCTKQKEVLASNFPTFKGIKVGSEELKSGPVAAFPTWYNTKTFETLSGFKSAEQLADMAKC